MVQASDKVSVKTTTTLSWPPAPEPGLAVAVSPAAAQVVVRPDAVLVVVVVVAEETATVVVGDDPPTVEEDPTARPDPPPQAARTARAQTAEAAHRRRDGRAPRCADRAPLPALSGHRIGRGHRRRYDTGLILMMAKVAPAWSLSTAKRPGGMSVG